MPNILDLLNNLSQQKKKKKATVLDDILQKVSNFQREVEKDKQNPLHTVLGLNTKPINALGQSKPNIPLVQDTPRTIVDRVKDSYNAKTIPVASLLPGPLGAILTPISPRVSSKQLTNVAAEATGVPAMIRATRTLANTALDDPNITPVNPELVKKFGNNRKPTQVEQFLTGGETLPQQANRYGALLNKIGINPSLSKPAGGAIAAGSLGIDLIPLLGGGKKQGAEEAISLARQVNSVSEFKNLLKNNKLASGYFKTIINDVRNPINTVEGFINAARQSAPKATLEGVLNQAEKSQILNKISEWNSTIHPVSLDRIQRKVNGENLILTKGEQTVLTDMQKLVKKSNALPELLETPKEGLSTLRTGGKNLATNVRSYDNPLVGGEEAMKDFKQNFQPNPDWIERNIGSSEELARSLRIRSGEKPDIPANERIFDEITRGIDVRKKANVLDYIRTPNRVLEKIGLGEEAKLLRQKFDEYKAELPQEIDRITEWSKRVSPSANQRIFDYLDGKLPRLDNPEELKVASEIKDYLKSWATRLKLPQDKQISSYITHLFPKGAVEKEFDPEVARLINSKVVKSVYDPFLQRRTNMPDYKRDTWQALDAYVKRATRKYHMDQALEKVSAKAQDLPLESYNYVKSYISHINMQPTQVDNLVDNFIKGAPIVRSIPFIGGYRQGQRPVAAITSKARRLVSRGLLGLNPGSALRNLQQSTNTYSQLGEKYFGIGIIKTLQNEGKFLTNRETEVHDVGILGKDIIQDRTLNATHKFWEKADKGLYYMFQQAENINRGVAYFGAKQKALDKGLSEAKAIEYAKDIVSRTQFNYDQIDTPVALQSDIAKTLFQFGKYPLAQAEFLAEMVKSKNISGSLRWLVGNVLFWGTVASVYNGKLTEAIPDFSRFSPTSGKFEPPALALPYEAYKASVNAPDQYGKVSEEQNPALRILESKGVAKGVTNYIPGGNQIFNKTIPGLAAFDRGYSKTKSGRARYRIAPTLDNLLRTALFGEYAAKESPAYFNKKK